MLLISKYRLTIADYRITWVSLCCRGMLLPFVWVLMLWSSIKSVIFTILFTMF